MPQRIHRTGGNANQTRESDRERRGAAQLFRAPAGRASHLADHRPQAVMQRQLQEAADNSHQAGRLGADRRMAQNSPRAMQLMAVQHLMGAPAVQRKEKQQLQQGVLNMIGETHTDYPDENARKYESKQVREAIGEDVKYFTEGVLKTDSKDKEYADPVHLRLEQVIAFVRDECSKLMPKLDGFKTAPLEAIAEQEELAGQEAALIVKQLGPKLKICDDESEIMQIIIEGKHSLAVLKKLEDVNAWAGSDGAVEQHTDNDNGHKSDDDSDVEDKEEIGKSFDDKVDDLTLLIMKESTKKEMEEQSEQSNEQENPVTTGRLLGDNVMTFHDKFKGRLPTTLLLYQHMKREGRYAEQEHFAFNPESIKPAVQAWDAIAKWQDKALQVFLAKDMAGQLKGLIATAYEKLFALMKALNEGMQDIEQRAIPDVTLARSQAMHKAATELKGEKIAWKVGELHVQDIKKLESENKIDTEYAYLQKDVFKGAYLDMQEMKKYKAPENNVDPSDKQAHDAMNSIISSEKKL